MIDRTQKQINENKKNIRRKIKKTRKSGLYNGWDIGEIEERTVTYKNVIYTITPKYYIVVDDYDEYLGSVELSHKESSGYSLISGYKIDDENIQTLDFTFARTEDIIELDIDENIEDIKINSRSLRYSTINSPKKLGFNIVFDKNVFDNALSFRLFIEQHKNIIESINFVGLSENKILKELIMRICAKNEIFEIAFEESTNSDNKTFVK